MVRAAVPVAYTEGFNPRQRIALAAPLAVGVTSDCELMDVFLVQSITPEIFRERVTPQLPIGLKVQEVQETALESPSLQAQMHGIEYRVSVETNRTGEEITQAIQTLLQAEHLPWEQIRDNVLVKYDLRPLVKNIWLISQENSGCTLGMQLHVTPRGTGRPEQVTRALGFTTPPWQIHRVRLFLASADVKTSAITEENSLE